MVIENLIVRSYQSADRQALFQIAGDTAFFGDPVEAFLDDRKLFFDTFYRYYVDYEPEYAWVACTDGQVVGFLTGCVDTITQRKRLITRILPSVVWRALQGGYQLQRKSWCYVRALVLSTLRSEQTHVDLRVYPAHLHLNIAASMRGYGLGKRLMKAYLGQLAELHVPGVHLSTTSMNETACRLYEKTGFQLLDAHPTQVWSHLLDQPVENRSYGLELAGEIKL